MAEDTLNKKRRGRIRAFITSTFNDSPNFHKLTSVEKRALKSKLVDQRESLKSFDELIQTEIWGNPLTKDTLDAELVTCDDYDDKINHCLAMLEDSSTGPNGAPGNTLDSARSLLRSPVAPLPKFSGKDTEDLTQFFYEFEETMSKYKCSEYDKLLLLKQQLSGRPLTLVASLEVEKLGYQHAKSLLEKAMGTKEVVMFNTIRNIINLKMSDSSDPFEYISKWTKHIESVRKLELNEDSFLQFFIWEGLTDDFKTQLTAITNKNKPDLTEILDNFFSASERYLETKTQKKRSVSKSEATSLAIDVRYESDRPKSFKPCTLCTKITLYYF